MNLITRFLLLGGLAAVLLLGSAPAQEVSRAIPLQGQLTAQDGTILGDGTYTLRLRLYVNNTIATPFWEDTFESVPAVRGVFNLRLGTQKSLDQVSEGTRSVLEQMGAQGPVYVGLTVLAANGETIADPPEMLPRLMLVPVPHAEQAGDAQRFGGRTHAELFNSRTALRAVAADEAAALDQHKWADFFLSGNPAHGGVVANAAKLRGLTRDQVALGTRIPPGTIWEQYGGYFDRVIDPRTLDSNNDGIPDRPIPTTEQIRDEQDNLLVTNIAGGEVDLTFTTWFACVQNATGTLRFPDPDTEDLSDEARTSYERVDQSLRGQLVPDREVPSSTKTGAMQWIPLDPFDANQAFTIQGTQESGIAYDPLLDAFWLVPSGITNATDISLIYRDTSNENRYRRRVFPIPIYGGINRRETFGSLYVITINSRRFLLMGSTGYAWPANYPMMYELFGTTVQSASMASVPTVIAPNWNVPYSVCLHDSQRSMLYTIGGNSGGAFRNGYRYNITASSINFVTPEFTLMPAARKSHMGVYDPVGDRIYIYGGDAGAGAFNNFWSISPANPTGAWTELSPTGTPPPVGQTGWMVKSPLDDKLILSPGYTNGVFPGTTTSLWIYDVSENSWEEFAQGSNSVWPSGRSTTAATVDTLRNRVVLIGGYNYLTRLANTEIWQLELDGSPSEGFIIKVDGAPE